MYRWQTLTLARVEASAGGDGSRFTPKQCESAKNLLLAIGLQHFPEPYVSEVNAIGTDRHPRGLYLRWDVDERFWEVVIDFTGKCDETARGTDGAIDGTFDPRTDYAGIKARVQWLLFGYTIGPKEPIRGDNSHVAAA